MWEISAFLGIVFLISGVFLSAKWRKEWKKEQPGWRPGKQTEKLVTTGLYGYVRHPHYLGILLVLYGVSLLIISIIVIFSLQSIYFLPPTLLLLVATLAFYVEALREEKKLIRRFGREYEEYRRRVPMFIPRPSLRRREIPKVEHPR